MTQSTPKLIYFGDPMCSWCYGFSPEMSAALDSLDGAVEFQLVMGGLRPYNTETMSDLGDFLKDHWQHVQEASGQPFSYEILKDTSFVYDTEPSCRAVVTMQQIKPGVAFEFFKKIQTAFYEQNKNTNEVNTYLNIAVELGIDKTTFQKAFESEKIKQAVRDQFTYSGKVGVRGFPTVFLQYEEKLYLITNGYTTADLITAKCKQVLSNKN